MAARQAVTLTPSEAVAAIVFDLHTYGSQLDLYCEVFTALGAREARPDEREGMAGVRVRGAGGWEFLPAPQAVSRLSRTLSPGGQSPEELARLCSLVFGEAARVLPGKHDGSPVILLETGMEGFACTRCGHCCLDLDFHLECTEADVALWRARGRDDILAWVGEQSTPQGPQYRIWMRPGTPLYAESCPFLRRVHGDTSFVCAINDVKPEVCRAYPGLRKHALKTGCKGIPRP